MTEPTSLPALADLLPHLQAGDRITAEFLDGYTIGGRLESHILHGRALTLLGRVVRRVDGVTSPCQLTAITDAPAAVARWREAQTPESPTWPDDPNVYAVRVTNELGYVDYTRRDCVSEVTLWTQVDCDEGAEVLHSSELIALKAVPTAWNVKPADNTAPAECFRCGQPATGGRSTGWYWCDEHSLHLTDDSARSVVRDIKGQRWEIDMRKLDADDPAPVCDRDHEPPEGHEVIDKHGVQWHPSGSLWLAGEEMFWTWTGLWDVRGPLTLVEDGPR